MNNSSLTLFYKNIVALYFFMPFSSVADVYIDMSEDSEISISQNYSESALNIEEPVSRQSIYSKKSGKFVRDINALPFNSEVLSAANESGIEPALIHAVIATESNHNPKAKSKKGAYGLMQLMPDTSRRFYVININDPKQNISAGTKYLRVLLNTFDGNLNLALAAYNAGPAAVKKYGGKIPPYKETINYVPKVLKYYAQYS